MLKVADSTVYNLDDCKKANPVDKNFPNYIVTNTNICLRSLTNKTTCSGTMNRHTKIGVLNNIFYVLN